MTTTGATGFVRGAAVATLAAAVPSVAWGVLKGDLGWALAGCALAAGTGLVAGARTAARIGTPGAAFFRAFGTGMLARLATLGAGAYLAARAGGGPAAAYVVGTAAGLAALTAWEIVWFGRAGRKAAAPTGGAQR